MKDYQQISFVKVISGVAAVTTEGAGAQAATPRLLKPVAQAKGSVGPFPGRVNHCAPVSVMKIWSSSRMP
jgi:hypothetical protein